VKNLLLDTDFLIALLRKDTEAQGLLETLIDQGNILCITHVNLWELYQGAFKSKNVEENLRDVDDLLQKFEFLEFSSRIDKFFAETFVNLDKQGLRIGVVDTLIASIAVENGMPVVTRNVDHFSKTNASILPW
jgi:predicted nucleic acid-binding protein